MRLVISSVLAIAACGGVQHPAPLTAQTAVGPASGDPGGVLVFSSRCAGMQAQCPATWAPTVDAIVTSGLAFHGYATIDPATLHKDEAHRTETTHDESSNDVSHADTTTSEAGAAGILPFASYTTTKGTTVSMHQSREKTVVIEGAALEDLVLADRKALMELAGARSVLTTQIIVGASWSAWSTDQDQTVEVMLKLSDADTGAMRWSARCAASSGNFPSAAAAIEAAAHCVADAMTTPHP
jgi:hypothetical protein